MRERRSTSRALTFAIALAGLTSVTDALAYCRTMTCSLGKDPSNDDCARDDDGCVTEGTALHWPSACLNYAVQVDGSPKSGLDADQVQALIEQAFALWQTAECPSGGNPRFSATFQGFVGCHEREAVCGDAGDNVNV